MAKEAIVKAIVHGTHVAGIIASRAFGVSDKANLYLFSTGENSGKGKISQDVVAKAYKQIIDLMDSGVKIDVVNMSYGNNEFNSVHNALSKRIHNKGAILVAAAGNSCDYKDLKGNCVPKGEGHINAANHNKNTILYPAKYNYVISVGATDIYGEKAIWKHEATNVTTESASGKGLDIIAPGTNIMSTLPNDKIGRLTGTSMAAPFVTGLIAKYKQQFPEFTNEEILEVLYENARKVSDSKRTEDYGRGVAERYPFGQIPKFKEVYLKGEYKVYGYADENNSPYSLEKLNGKYRIIRGKGYDPVSDTYKYSYILKDKEDIGWVKTSSN
jgi:subtilisin family serine protease